MATHNFYTTLGIKNNATQAEIKQAYRRLAKKYHPDVSEEANAEAQFKKIVEAYDTLKDPEKRRHYDSRGSTGNSAFAGFDPDIFGDLFKQPPTQKTSKKTSKKTPTKTSTDEKPIPTHSTPKKTTQNKKKSKPSIDMQQQIHQLIDELENINEMLKQIENEHNPFAKYRFHTLLQELHQETCLLAKEASNPKATQTAIELYDLIEAMQVTLSKLTPN